MAIILTTVLMLIASNIFMTFAWYGHLKDLKDKPWLMAAMISWCIAFFAGEFRFNVAAAEDPAGGDHVVCFCSIYGGVYEAIASLGLSVGCSMHVRCGIFYFPPRRLVTSCGVMRCLRVAGGCNSSLLSISVLGARHGSGSLRQRVVDRIFVWRFGG